MYRFLVVFAVIFPFVASNPQEYVSRGVIDVIKGIKDKTPTSGNCITKCPWFQIYKFLPHDDCNKYCVCFSKLRLVVECEEGTYFSAKHDMCVDPTESECGKVDGCFGQCLHESLNANVLLAHEDCNKYCRCNKGRPLVENCAPNYQFNVEKQLCLPQEEASCDRLNGYTTTTTLRPSTTSNPSTTSTSTNSPNTSSSSTTIQPTSALSPSTTTNSSSTSSLLPAINPSSTSNPLPISSPLPTAYPSSTLSPLPAVNPSSPPSPLPTANPSSTSSPLPSANPLTSSPHPSKSNTSTTQNLQSSSDPSTTYNPPPAVSLPALTAPQAVKTPSDRSVPNCAGHCPSNDDPESVVLLAHKDCTKYCRCLEGHPIIKNCPTNYHFSLNQEMCLPSYYTSCHHLVNDLD